MNAKRLFFGATAWLLVFCLYLPSTAAAEKDSGATSTKSVSLTFSPVHLRSPILEVQGEYGFTPKISAAGLAGYGTMTAKSELTDEEITFNVWELGGQFRYYPVGDFEHGLQVGAELLYVGLETQEGETLVGQSVAGTGEGLALGPFLGYKYAAGLGFTIDIQVGIQRALARAKGESNGQKESGEDEDWIPLLNLNVGWSF